VKVHFMLAAALLAGVALFPVPVAAATRASQATPSSQSRALAGLPAPSARLQAAPPNETEAQRIARETQQAARAAERSGRATSLAPLSPSQRQRLAAPTAGSLTGRWTNCRLPADFNPVHASVLPDGSVLLMAGSGNNPAELAAGHFQSFLFFPDTCATFSLPTPGDLFCAGHAMLPNGNILVAGGTKQYDPFYGQRTSYEYDWAHRQFVKVASMAGGRWYPGATELGSGDVFVNSGLNGAGALNARPEIYNYRTRTWSVVPYVRAMPNYAHMLPTAGGRLFFTGESFGGSAVSVGFLTPKTGSFQAVRGLDTNRRDEGASFFIPLTEGRKVMVAGGGVATTARIDLYSSPNPLYSAGPKLDVARKYLSHATLFDGRVLLAGGQDPQGNPVYTAQLYRPGLNRIENVAPYTAAHQYHSNMWVDPTGRAILVGGNPARGSVQSLVEKFEPWYVDVGDRPAITSAPASIAHKKAFTVGTRLAAGTTLKSVRLYRLTSTTHQFGAAEGDFTLVKSGSAWSLTTSVNLTPPGYYYLIAVDSRDVPSVAKIVKIT
jgi:hypothetical protein